MQQNTIAVLRDAFLDNNQTTIAALVSELATLIKATTVGIDHCGVFAEFKYEEHRFRLRYLEAERPYWMAEFLTTQEFYELVIGKNPSYFKGLDLPVTNVTFDNAIGFCEKLNLYFKIPGMKFDLPTKEEWLAAKPYEYEGIDLKKDEELKRVAWFCENSNDSTHSVGQKQSNINGLYDLLGNAWEWTKTDHETERGGSWFSPTWFLRCSDRLWLTHRFRDLDLGFRVMLRNS